MPPLPSKEVSIPPIRVLLANLPVMMSELLHKVLDSVSDIQVVEPPIYVRHLSKVSLAGAVDVIVLGSSWLETEHSAVDIVQYLRDRDHGIRVIVLSEKPSYKETIALFRAGAHGIVSGSDLQFDLLCKSIRCVYDGQIWANNELLKHLVASLGHPRLGDITDSRGKLLLTNREQQVLQLLADGLSNAELAATLKLSGHTVKNHLFRIYDKLGVSTRMEAVLYAFTPRTLPGTGNLEVSLGIAQGRAETSA
jgi:DNA-binding NarL/FixJ family response regulator